MSRFTTKDPNIQFDPETEGHVFGYYVFDSLPDISTVLKQE